LDQIGLAGRIFDANIGIDFGRKGFSTRGKEQEGRISYEEGITKASSAFEEAQVSADPQTILF